MVTLNDVKAANAALVNRKPFVAVIAGGTAGIGECAVRGLASIFAAQGDQLRVYIIGRNQEAAEKVASDCESLCPGGTFRFIQGNLALIKEVDRICAEITEAEHEHAKTGNQMAKVDFLLCSQGVITTVFQDTVEGIDRTFSLSFFSRMRFVVQLLPLLSNAPNGGHFVSVFNARIKPSIRIDDMGLRKPSNQGFSVAFGHITGMTNVFISELARRNPGKIALSHVYPGFVNTAIGEKAEIPGWWKFISKWFIKPLTRRLYIPFDEVAQRMVYMATDRFTPALTENAEGVAVAEGLDGIKGSGAYRVDNSGETYPHNKEYVKLRDNGDAEKVYQYTMEVFKDIETNGVHKE
ncbi:hypothetical protein F5Y19DRAFT_480138 [Xylariaceae sp. FL1651]|nr:hypothetical protein F5Y19DRAFT_480138 [Xylariaceae sp. FL1651]